MSTPNPFLPTYQDRQKKTTVVARDKNETLANTLGIILKQVYNNNTDGYIKMLNLIANGKSASMTDFASAFQYPSFLLKTYFYFNNTAANFDFDSKGNIIGIGLTHKPTKHHIIIRGNSLYTWCALDLLLFPLMLNEAVQVKTPCPLTGTEIAFSISPRGIKDLNLEGAAVSFVIPNPAEAKDNIRKSFCHFANFFQDSKTAAEWKAQHPQALILSIDEAFAFTEKVVFTLIESPKNKIYSRCCRCSVQ